MNARYYVPEVGRFASPDTIVPDPSNPQSFNRYSYTRNNPVNLIDPSGHREIGEDGNDILPHQPPPSITQQLSGGYNVYGVTFTADEGQQWTDEQMGAALSGVAAVDRQLRIAGQMSGYMPGAAFRKIYGSYIMHRSSKGQDWGAETFSWVNTIEFYAKAFKANQVQFRNNVVHELGHAFNGELSSSMDESPYNQLGTALGSEGALNKVGIAGPRSVMPGAPVSEWQQSPRVTQGEYFADYFLNWVYGSFLDNNLGSLTYSWMDQHMTTWLR